MALLISPRPPDAGLGDIELLDAHCHPVTVAALDDTEFASWCTESDRGPRDRTGPRLAWHGGYPASLDSHLGLAIRRWCGPALGLPAGAPLPDYLAARRYTGPEETARLLLRASGLAGLLIDTGVPAEGMPGPAGIGHLAGAPAREVVRLETLAESVIDGCGASGYPVAVAAGLHAAYSGGAIGAKSIAAYRCGLDLASDRPGSAEVRAAAGGWLRARERGPARLVDPILIRHLLWLAVDAGRPIQLHTGFGDADASLIGANPALLQPLCEVTRDPGTPLVLLHCYPYHREAGWLAHLYPHVYVDVGLTVNHLGFRSIGVLAEFLELAPWQQIMYSSDAYGLPELYRTGAAQFRHSLGRVLGEFVGDGAMAPGEARAVAAAIGARTAERVYGPLT